MRPRTKLLLILIPLLALACLLFTLLIYLLNRPYHRVIWQDCQPAAVHYDDFDPYCLSVVERSVDWSAFPFNIGRHYYLFIGRGAGQPEYGHVKAYSFHNEVEEINSYLQQSTVEWSDDGATFHEASGHTLFFPKDMFVGGR